MAKIPLARMVPIVTPPGVFADARGTFQESWRAVKGVPAMRCGLTSGNKQGALRGLHFQRNKPRALLVRCVMGAIWDVVVDIRKGPTHGQVMTHRLSDDASEVLFVPPGYAHGFYAMTDAIVIYECSAFYDEASSEGLYWQAVPGAWRGIVGEAVNISEKDAKLPAIVEPMEMP